MHTFQIDVPVFVWQFCHDEGEDFNDKSQSMSIMNVLDYYKSESISEIEGYFSSFLLVGNIFRICLFPQKIL